MSKNIVKDIAQIYTQISESSHLETDMQKRRENNEKAIRDMKNTKAHKDMVAAVRKKFDEAAKPDYLDFDGDSNEKESMKKALKDKSKKKVEEANDGNLANNYPPYDKVTRGDVIAGRLGKDQMGGKKKSVKEGFSNWREDLFEVVDGVEKKEKSKQIKEKKVKNKININPDMKESVEEIGGVLIEMIEMDELDGLIESVYEELLDEGYEEDDIEEAIEYALTEAKVTLGHDTPSTEKKKKGLLGAARERLSSAKSSAKAAVARGARKVAKGALGVARKMEGGKKPHTAERKPSTYRGAGAGQKEKVSSGSYKAPEKKKAKPVSDPWEGSYKKSSEIKTTKAKPAKPVSDPWEGSATTPPKPKAKKAAAKPKASVAKPEASTAKPKPKSKVSTTKKKKSNLDNLLDTIRNEEVQLDEKSLSRAQQRFMGMVYAAKKGETPASPEVAKAAAGMSKKEARKFAKTKHEGLPEKKEVKEEQDPDTRSKQIQQRQLQLDRLKLQLRMKQAQQKKKSAADEVVSSEQFDSFDESRRMDREGVDRGDSRRADRAEKAKASLAARVKRQAVLDKHEKKTGTKLDISRSKEGREHAKNFPGSRQAPKVKGAKETPSETQNRRVNRQNQRVLKHGFTKKETERNKGMQQWHSARD